MRWRAELSKDAERHLIRLPRDVQHRIARAIDELEVELYQGNRLLIAPKKPVDKHPEIERRLAEAEDDVRASRVSGPFKNRS
jgi:hypothetical protein